MEGEPPAVRSRLDKDVLYGIIDAWNYVLVSPRRRRARVVASANMLDWPYHLRYELIEFAVFLLAARCQRLVPLHARSEEHTSELQSLMRNSYAVFWLKTNK